ncbi:hypothetical protein OHJ16_08995 [Actinomyces israelii]|uniref:DUF2746 domain-containing protein n=1 Tax=Actinomyces israelii TaxID=1659 RepID=A0ABT4IA96_9ACTO|nr:hypothetical protein [Actinomyces israelii]MCZ0858177.1 hypothetical protein [Actinomyces israelii]
MTPAPHPVVQVLTAPEVVTASTVAVAAILGLLGAFIRAQTRRVEQGLSRLRARVEAARTAADAARDGVTNQHGTHLREDLDEVRAQLSTVLARLDTAETARQTDVERQDATLSAISTRVARVEMQADGLRADIRALDGRVTRQDQALQDRLTEN